ncbi:MAG TPA: mannitol dehydrogenase family protein [Alphaproteobacteria bacterium]|nr:mannitol dehydrogenase family protein [Alphaproteobacteria bacterium]
MKRLSLATLGALPGDVARPSFDPRSLGTGIVHLGIGAFHRAHMAAYTQDALAKEPGAWGICGVSLRSSDIRDRLVPQDGLYTLVVRGREAETLTTIGTVRDVLFAPENPTRVIARIADPTTRIVSLTVTEKGYCHDPATGALRESDPGIVHDLAHKAAPKTAIGMLVRGLEARCCGDAGRVTVLCCDNLPHNGRSLRGVARRFAELVDPDLADWMDEHVAFPSTMVDRIVPATTPRDVSAVEARLGLKDVSPVLAEPFRQWVIEDDFAAGRPCWDRVGAELVRDVGPYEDMKLRLLNGSHSAMAYLGYLAGYEFIYQVIADSSFERVIDRLMSEAATTLKLPAGVDVGRYRRDLIERFANPALGHRCYQIAMDGSQKLPQRLLGTIRDRLKKGASIDALALAVAAWMRYVRAVDEKASAYEVQDPLAARLREAASSGDASAQVDRLLQVREVFGGDLPQSSEFRTQLVAWLSALDQNGAKATVAAAAKLETTN